MPRFDVKPGDVAYSDRLAQRTFRYSIVYVSVLFAALLVDHYVRIVL